jgi:hypothetical protein
VLERLQSLAASLGETYSWQQSQATTFVLTGLAPIVPAIRSATVGGVPLSSTMRIVLEVNPETKAREVLLHYKRARERSRKRLGPVSDKDCNLAVVATNSRGKPWSDSMREWNARFPKWRYEDPRRFQRDAVSARRRLVDPW